MPPNSGTSTSTCVGRFLVVLIGLAFSLSWTSCAPVSITRPVTKIGLIAPVEGPLRAQGYDAVFAARLALREVNEGSGAEGWSVELVALDDGGDPQRAQRQIRALGADPDIVWAIHVADPGSRQALLDVYRRERLNVEFVSSDIAPVSHTQEFTRAYASVSGGIAPGPLAESVYSAVGRAIVAIGAQVRAGKRPGRAK